MARLYSATFKGIAVTAAQDFFQILAAAGVPIVIHGWALSQSSEAGDAAEEQLRLETIRGVGTVTDGSGGAAITAQQTDDADTAAAATVERNNTTRMAVGTGTLEDLESYAWNVRVPFVHWYPPEARPLIRASARWTLGTPSTPADSIDVSGTVWFEERG